MLMKLVLVVVGVVIGWHWPKPVWVTNLVEKVKGLVVKK